MPLTTEANNQSSLDSAFVSTDVNDSLLQITGDPRLSTGFKNSAIMQSTMTEVLFYILFSVVSCILVLAYNFWLIKVMY